MRWCLLSIGSIQIKIEGLIDCTCTQTLLHTPTLTIRCLTKQSLNPNTALWTSVFQICPHSHSLEFVLKKDSVKAQTHTDTDRHIQTHTHTHTHTHTDTHRQTDTYRHTHTRTHTDTHRHTQTHTDTYRQTHDNHSRLSHTKSDWKRGSGWSDQKIVRPHWGHVPHSTLLLSCVCKCGK